MEDLSFTVVTTTDGSPSLQPAGALDETMHSREGALSESVFLYGFAVEKALARGLPLRALSAGLGLGYNELIVAALATKYSRSLASLHSYETVPSLRLGFEQFVLRGHPLAGDDVDLARDKALSLVAQHYEVDKAEVLAMLASALKDGRWFSASHLDATNFPAAQANVVLYDFFSKGSQPEVWTESFLEQMIRTSLDSTCIWSTYAATGSLKRALRSQGFDILRSEGFAYKKQSTLAGRGGGW